MIRSTDGSSTRRILTYPVIQPCEGASPATLLSSLIGLSQKICLFKSSSTFVSNERNAKNAIRLVEILLIFLEELRDGYHQDQIFRFSSDSADHNPDLHGSLLLSLSELHLVFQKILFLLEDCACEDARLWMLAKFNKVANHFRVAGRDLSTALEIFPMGLVSTLSVESIESVQFVVRQSKGVSFGSVDRRDDWALGMVLSVLDRFERGVIPDPDDLKRVMNYIRVRDWGNCNREMKFLKEEMIHSQREKDVSRESVLPTGLLGYMIYCRCMIYGSLCTEGARENAKESDNDSGLVRVVSSLNEEDLRCPISLEVMADPVTLSTGHTFDRMSIMQWFRAGNPTCPKTGKRLQNLGCVPNVAIQRLTRQYAVQKGIAIPVHKSGDRPAAAVSAVLPRSQVFENAIKMVSDFLSIKLAIGTKVEKNKAAYEIRLLTKRSNFNRACFVESGLIPYLLNLLLSRDPLAQENATAALLNLSKHPQGKPIIVRNGGLELILRVLKDSKKLEAQQNAAALLFYLSSVEEYSDLIGSMPDSIPALINMIRVGGDRGKKNSLAALFGLLLHPNNHQRVLSAKAVPLLVNLLSSLEKEDLITDVLAVLSALAEKPNGSITILRAGALDTVVRVFCSLNSRFGREHSVSLMQSLCLNGGRDVVRVLAKDPSLMQSLYSLLTNGTPRASKQASSIIHIVHEFSEESSNPSAVLHHHLPNGHFIHVR